MTVKHVLSETMFKVVETLSSPHGEISVWESLYPGDKGQRDRFVVALDGSLRKWVYSCFEQDGFFHSTCGYSRSEALTTMKRLQAASVATQLTGRFAEDPVVVGRVQKRWQYVSAGYQRNVGAEILAESRSRVDG